VAALRIAEELRPDAKIGINFRDLNDCPGAVQVISSISGPPVRVGARSCLAMTVAELPAISEPGPGADGGGRMDQDQVPGRAGMVARALRLVTVSVVFGVVSGVVSVASGLSGHSLGVFAVGLDVLADVTGSAALIWRFRAEQRRPGHTGRQADEQPGLAR